MSTALAVLILVAVVAFGAVIPIVPTGAAVSAAAVLARADQPWHLILVVAGGALGAYLGDVVVYAGLRRLGAPFAQRVGWLQREDPQAALQRIRARIEAHELRTLLISRLVPGGRVPVLLAAALGGYPLRRFATAAIAAALLWSTAYSAIGLLGDTMFADDRVALVAVIVAAIAISVGMALWQRTRPDPDSSAAP